MKQKYYVLGLIAVMIWSTDLKAQDFTTAKEVLEANLEATGGRAKWEAVERIERSGSRVLDMSMGTHQSTFTTYDKYPGYSRTDEEISSPMGSMNQLIVSTPEGRWTTTRQGRREMPPQPWISSEAAKDELFLLTDDNVILHDLETDMGENGPEYVVSFDFNGETFQRKYNQFTLFLTAAEAPGNRGGITWTTFDEYKEVDGFQIPHVWESVATVTINQNGSESTDEITVLTNLESIAFNEAFSDDLFSEE